MSESPTIPTTHTEAEIVRVPTPNNVATRPARVLAWMAVIFSVVTVVFVLKLWMPGAFVGGRTSGFGRALMLSGVVFCPVIWAAAIHHLRLAARFRGTRGALQDNCSDIGKKVFQTWQRRKRRVKPKSMHRILTQHPPVPGSRGRVVVMGAIDVPEVGELFFEPFVVTPTERAIKGNWMLIQGAVVLPLGVILLWLFPLPIGRGLIGQGVGLLVMTLPVVAWRVFRRPLYIRIAPRVIQLLRYPTPGRGAPSIDEFPVDANFALVVQTQVDGSFMIGRGKKPLTEKQVELMKKSAITMATVDLFHGDRSFSIKLRQSAHPAELLEALFRAALTTARRPELHPVELTG